MLNKYYWTRIFLCAILSFTLVFSQTDGRIDGLTMRTPDISVSLGLGFNYDYLRSPLNVSFDNARGFYSVNIPIRFAPGDDIMDEIFDGVSMPFTDNERFIPQFSARQFANTTIRVDVPMLGGVCSFSHMNVMSLRYENRTGIPSFLFNTADMEDPMDDGINMIMRGMINTPIDFSLGWEAMTFGYVYRLNDLFMFGLSLHRHRFHFNLSGNLDVDINGTVEAEVDNFRNEIEIYYSLRNPIMGEYSLERWSPTFAARIWNFDIMARIMFKDRAKGSLRANYSLPFFVDPSNFNLTGDLDDMNFIIDNITNGNFMSNEQTSVKLQTNESIRWELPHVLTLKYNIVPESEYRNMSLSLSYSKFIGRAHLGLTDPNMGIINGDDRVEFLEDGLDFRTSLRLDHLILASARFGWFFGTLGIVSLDIDFNEEKNILRNNTNEVFLIPYGRGAMLPILSGGGIIGTNLQLMLELNLLPLPAFKTGLVYNF
ncbi:MAG: hypothetical protein FWE23_07190 [Chitinivibrionia bacterium]|jgi:hypothetical protein|nr:hypothetical protein [Chitinivibrionia bacterium]